MKFSISIEYKPLKNDHGSIRKLSDTRYSIQIDSRAPLLTQIGTLFHELTHLVFWMVFNQESIGAPREHKICRDIDAYSTKKFRGYLEG